jgi:hypothetical protein
MTPRPLPTAVDMDRAVDVLVDQARVFDGAPRRFSFEIFRRELEHGRGNRVFEHRMTRHFRFAFLQLFSGTPTTIPKPAMAYFPDK